MKKYNLLLLCVLFCTALSSKPPGYDPYVALQFDLGQPVDFIQAAPVALGGGQNGFVFIFSESHSIDPYEGGFSFPKHTPKIAVFTSEGKELWRRELTNSIPGIWFIPVLPFDMDGDGVDEIYYVNNISELPFNYDGYKLERADARTGEVTGQWPWEQPTHNQANSYKWRFMLLGGYVDGEPVLVTAQGTYRDIRLQAWNKDMKLRWKRFIPDDYKGSRGSHSSPVLDLYGNGSQQFMYGERCITFDKGDELFVLDGDIWGDHSDTVLPFYDSATGKWNFFTTREKGDDGKLPRVVMFDQDGKHLWEIDEKKGHYHYGWVGNFGPNGERVAMAGRYPNKTEDLKPKTCVGKFYDATSGEIIDLPIPLTGTVIDFNGDGIHELFHNKALYDNKGNKIFSVGTGKAILSKKILPLAGEQLMIASPDGKISVWADRNASDTPQMRERFADKIYRDNLRMSASGYNTRFPILNY